MSSSLKTLLYIGNKLLKHGKTPTSVDILTEKFIDEGYAVISASSKKNKVLRLLDMVLHIIKYRSNIDYILIDTYSTTNFYYAYISAVLAQLLKVNYIPILHGGNLPRRLERHPNLCKRLFKNAKVNVTPSKYLYEKFKEKGYTNLTLVPNSIEGNRYPFKLRERVIPKLLWVSAFDKIYNPKLALQVLKKLQENYPEASLCMVGPDKDGSLKECKAFSDKHKLNVIFTGRLRKEEWIELSSNYDIFINTTTIDNTPVSVIEAMALGLPVISTNVGGMPFLIDDCINGVLVPKDDKEAMLQAILNLIEQPKLASKLSISARHKVEDYDWTSIKNKWKSLLS